MTLTAPSVEGVRCDRDGHVGQTLTLPKRMVRWQSEHREWREMTRRSQRRHARGSRKRAGTSAEFNRVTRKDDQEGFRLPCTVWSSRCGTSVWKEKHLCGVVALKGWAELCQKLEESKSPSRMNCMRKGTE